VIAYVDTSALLKLVVEEEGSTQVGLLWDTADALVSVALVGVEARAALAAARRGRRLTAPQHRQAAVDLVLLIDQLSIVDVTEELIERAGTLAEDDGLRGYDAVHLAAALTVDATVMASADTDLCHAAERHGLHIANPLT
jgi:predicted nucleic acid-binding protein